MSLCCSLFVKQGFEAVDWERLTAEIERHTRPVVNGEQLPVLLVEGTMVLNYRFDTVYVVVPLSPLEWCCRHSAFRLSICQMCALCDKMI